MSGILVLIFGCILFLFLFFMVLITVSADQILLLLGYKKYKFNKYVGFKCVEEFVWHKSDEEALKYGALWTYIFEVKPKQRMIKP